VRSLAVCAARDDEQVVPKFVNSSPRSNEDNRPSPRRCSIVRFPEHHTDATCAIAIRIPSNGPPSFYKSRILPHSSPPSHSRNKLIPPKARGSRRRRSHFQQVRAQSSPPFLCQETC